MAIHDFIILLCITTDNFTYQGESGATQRVNPFTGSTLPLISKIIWR